MSNLEQQEAARNFLGQFANLRNTAGNPTYEKLASKANSSKQTVSRKLSASALADLPLWDFFHPMVTFLITEAQRLDLQSEDVGDIRAWGVIQKCRVRRC
jgi:hypothetical protein